MFLSTMNSLTVKNQMAASIEKYLTQSPKPYIDTYMCDCHINSFKTGILLII